MAEKKKQIPVDAGLHSQLKTWCGQNHALLSHTTERAIAMFLATNGKGA